MRTMRWVGLAAVILTSACGGGADEGWEFQDEPIIIWTEPRPGADGNGGDTTGPREDGDDEPDEDPDEPRRPMEVPTEREPTVSPVACDAEFDVVSVPGTITGTLERGSGPWGEMPCGIAPGKEQRFTIDVPRDMGVQISMAYEDADFPPILLLQSGCGEDTRDRMCSSPIGSHPEGLNANIRAFLKAGTYTLVVDERNILGFGEGGRFTVHLDEIELAPTATCDTPESLWIDNFGAVSEPNTGTTGDLQTCFGTSQSRHFWKLEVPAGRSYRVRAEYDDPDASQHPLVFIADGCDATCEGVGAMGAVSVANESDEPRTYYVGVTDFREMGYEVFIDGAARLEDNLSCETARHVEANQSVEGELLAGSSWAPICGGNQSRQLYYSVDVPPGHRLFPDAPGAYVGLLDSCNPDEQICAEAEVNDTNRTIRQLVTVGDWNRGDQRFTFTPKVVEVASNSLCSAAQDLNAEGFAWGYFEQGRRPDSSCGFVHPGLMLHYSVTIPANTTATIEAQGPENGVNVGIVDECGGSCLASHDTYLYGPGDVALELTNETNEPKTYIVQAAAPDGFTGTSEGYVVLSVKLP